MKRYRNSDLKALLSKFKDHLTCWKVGLSIGSMLYIEMGRKWSARLKSGSLVEIGSVTLVLESDEWTITRRGNPISDANSVTQDMVDRLASKYFIGQVLDSIQFLADSKQCVISFSDGVDIHLQGESEEDICAITFPDGAIIACHAKRGLYSDGSRSEPHVAAYTHDQLKRA